MFAFGTFFKYLGVAQEHKDLFCAKQLIFYICGMKKSVCRKECEWLNINNFSFMNCFIHKMGIHCKGIKSKF